MKAWKWLHGVSPADLLALLVGYGAVLRIVQYLQNRSLWVDEAMLALNILERSVWELLQPLDLEQGAPIGFLIVQKLLTDLFGPSEYSLRLFPLLCGLASLPLFVRVARRVLDTGPALVLGTALFALSYKLVYYASESKQYSADVAVTLGLYWVFDRVRMTAWNLKAAVTLGLVGAAALWFSHPATFVLAGLGVCLAASFARRKTWAALSYLLLSGVMWAASFGVAYVLSLRRLGSNESLLSFWAHGFMPLPPRALADLRWFDETLLAFFREAAGLLPGTLACVALVAGAVWLATVRRQQLLVLISPVLFTLGASALKLYPFSGRLVLFAVPIALILVAQGVIVFSRLVPQYDRILIGAGAALLVVPQLLFSSAVFVRPYTFEDVRPAIAYARQRWQPDDLMYVYHGVEPTFRYYAGRFGFQNGEYLLGQATREDAARLRAELEAAGSRGRLWMLFGHVNRSNGIDDEDLFRKHLLGRKELADSVKYRDAAVYLYQHRRR
jgi:hypothetical protein